MGNVHMEAAQINYRGGGTKKSVEQAIKDATELTPEQKTNINKIPTIESAVSNLSDTKANQITIAPFFSAEASYDPGDLVYYNGLSYRCVNAHEGEWDADDFAATTIANELNTLKSGLTAKIDQITVGEVIGATFADFILGVLDAINIGNGKLTMVYAVHPNNDYYVFNVLRLYDDVYMFTANNTARMFHGKAITGINYVAVYEVTSTLVTN